MNKRTFSQIQWTDQLKQRLRDALAEDIGNADLTTQYTVPEHLDGHGSILAKQKGILCGAPVAHMIWKMVDKNIKVQWTVDDGQPFRPGQNLASLDGPMHGLLTGERVALNFLQRLSGVATLTRQFHEAAGGAEGPLICDTRKTTPLWRALERYAVTVGGGVNHRFGLFDMVLIKENHARAAGGLDRAIRAARNAAHPGMRIAAEAHNEHEVQVCCEHHVDLVLLDNFDPLQARRVIDRFRPTGIPFEISGGVSLDNIDRFAHAGPDRISVGALTHSAPALDLSVQLDPV